VSSSSWTSSINLKDKIAPAIIEPCHSWVGLDDWASKARSPQAGYFDAVSKVLKVEATDLFIH